MSNCALVTQYMKKEMVESFLDFFKTTNQDSWFIALGNPIYWSFDREIAKTNTIYRRPVSGNDKNIPLVQDTDKEKYDFYRTCTAMKRILSDDVSFLIPRNKWEQNNFYYPYRDDREMFSEQDNLERPFYVYNEDTRCVYKCIENNFFGASATPESSGRSLFPPTGTNTQIIDTNDGYKWKFMYQLSTDDEFKFLTRGRSEKETFIPVKYINYDPVDIEEVKQKETQDAAINGSLSSIYVNDIFRNLFKYDPVLTYINSEEPLYPRIDYSIGATTIDFDYYGNNSRVNAIKDMYLYVYDGEGSGQIRDIKSSSREKIGSSYYLRVNIDPLDEGLSGFVNQSVGSRINVIPKVDIFGDGEAYSPTGSNNSLLETALAIPIFDGDGFLKGTNLLDVGKNYTFAKAKIPRGLTSVNVSANPEIPEDLLKASMSPFNGHGSNAVLELGASRILFKTDFEGTESNSLNPTNDFRQIALIKNPEFTFNTAIIRTIQDDVGSGISAGSLVELSGSGITAYGTVENIYEFDAGTEGREFIVKGLSGDIGNYTDINQVDIDPNDGLEFVQYAGLENKNVTVLVAESDVTLVSSRDYLIGAGNKTLGISPSFSSGRVLEIKNNREVSVEKVRGNFKDSEKVLAVSPGGTGTGSFIISDIYESTPSTFKNAYNMTTKLFITSAEDYQFTPSTFDIDNIVYGFETNEVTNPQEDTPFKTNAFVFDWTVEYSAGNSNTGILEVVGSKLGSFSVGDYVLYYKDNIARYAIINNIVHPEILYGSGEVLYVQNFSGIERFFGNNEQVNLTLGL